MLGAPAVTVAVFTAVAVPAGVSHADTIPTISVRGGETQPTFSRADAVYQSVDVQTTVDSDNDGVPDTVRVRILRPKETEPPGSGRHSGSKITSELLGGTPETRAAQVARAAQVWSGYYDNYFLPRGYAVAQVDSIDSGGSTGCPTIGDRNETLGVKGGRPGRTGGEGGEGGTGTGQGGPAADPSGRAGAGRGPRRHRSRPRRRRPCRTGGGRQRGPRGEGRGRARHRAGTSGGGPRGGEDRAGGQGR